MGAFVFRGTEALYTGTGNGLFPGYDANYLVGLGLYVDCVRAFCAAYSLEEIIEYLEGMAGFSLGDRLKELNMGLTRSVVRVVWAWGFICRCRYLVLIMLVWLHIYV